MNTLAWNNNLGLRCLILLVSRTEVLIDSFCFHVYDNLFHDLSLSWHSLWLRLRRYLIVFDPQLSFLIKEDILDEFFRIS